MMALYAERVFPRIMNVVMNTKETRRIRAEVCAPLHGDVVEIGFGSGHNLPFLPDTVTRVLAVDPMQIGPRLAAERIATANVPVEFVGLDGQSLELADDSMDSALATWTLCSIPDAVAAVREIRRVLKPGGTFHFVEHGRSPDDKVRRNQDRFNGIQNKLACGCNLNRDIPQIVGDGGMTISEMTTYYAKGDPKTLGWMYQGIASA